LVFENEEPVVIDCPISVEEIEAVIGKTKNKENVQRMR
jgi:hypothetical protein